MLFFCHILQITWKGRGSEVILVVVRQENHSHIFIVAMFLKMSETHLLLQVHQWGREERRLRFLQLDSKTGMNYFEQNF